MQDKHILGFTEYLTKQASDWDLPTPVRRKLYDSRLGVRGSIKEKVIENKWKNLQELVSKKNQEHAHNQIRDNQ